MSKCLRRGIYLRRGIFLSRSKYLRRGIFLCRDKYLRGGKFLRRGKYVRRGDEGSYVIFHPGVCWMRIFGTNGVPYGFRTPQVENWPRVPRLSAPRKSSADAVQSSTSSWSSSSSSSEFDE